MLKIPQLLDHLLATGRWPRNDKEAKAQNLKPLAPPERVRLLAPEETSLYLLPPPFRTVRWLSSKDDFWTWPHTAPAEIDFGLALNIGDFGLGSDAPILLDYRGDPENPSVIRLRWTPDRDNHWVVTAKDFQTFVEILGL